MSVGKLLRRLFGLPPEDGSHPAAVMLSDHGRQFQVILDPGLPGEAFEQLFHLDLSQLPSGVLTWDRRLGVWRDA